MSNMNIPGLSVATTPAPPPGLINSTDPNTVPPVGPVSTVPKADQTNPATATSYTPQGVTVTPEQTVSGQIKNIIASGSPLMQQAERDAKNFMQQRGLINSSMAITAGQDSVYKAALPVATADAATYAKAATDTTAAQNAALAAGATAENAASATNAQIAGSTNIADMQSATQQAIAKLQADTTLTAQEKQDRTQELIARLQSTTTLDVTAQQLSNAKDLQTMQGAVQTAIANIQANTSMSNQDKQDATARVIAQIQSNTQLSVQDKAAAAQQLITAANNASAKAIAEIQANTSLSITEKQTQSAQVIAGMNNDNARAVQAMVNAGNLATIQANGVINKEITQMTNDNKTLLQTSAGASNVYSQGLANIVAIMGNKDLSEEQKATALNNVVATIKDSLKVISDIANNTATTSTLDFTTNSDGSQSVTLPDGSIIKLPPGAINNPPAQTNTGTQQPAQNTVPPPPQFSGEQINKGLSSFVTENASLLASPGARAIYNTAINEMQAIENNGDLSAFQRVTQLNNRLNALKAAMNTFKNGG